MDSIQETRAEQNGRARYTVTPLRQFPINEAAPKFPDAALPGPVKRFVREAANAIGCPADSIGLAALVNLGACIGNARVIQPKRGWTEGACIYGAVIAESGEKKTAAVGVATEPTQRLDHKLNRHYEQKLDEYGADLREYEVDRKNHARNALPAPPPPKKPTAERVHVNDTTVEALIPILKANPRGVLQERDELVGWIKSMDQYKASGRGSDRQFWLSVWSNRPVSVDRKGQDAPISVLRPFIGLIGSIQPDVLEELATNREDGMLERFLLAYPSAINSFWTEDEVSEETKAQYWNLCQKLRQLSMDTDELGDPVEVPVTFSPEAKEVYVQVYNEHRAETAQPGFPRHLRAAWAKLEGYLLRLTLIMAACRFVQEGGPQVVKPTEVWRAVLLIDYFKDQARRVFDTLRGFDMKKALLADVVRLVEENGNLWMGTATELHEQLKSPYKPERPDELSKFIKDAAADEEDFIYSSDIDRYKDENGEWKSVRTITLYRKSA